MTSYLQNLLQRLADDTYRPGEQKMDGVYESNKTVSWQAHEEARNLAEETLLPVLYTYLEETVSEEARRNAYFVVGFIGKNTMNEEVARFLLNRLKKEKQTLILTLLLDRLAELYKPETFDLSVIYRLIEKKGLRIRISAYLALTNTGHKVEAYLLEKLDGAKTEDDISGIIRALQYVGTKRTVAAVKPLFKNRKLEIKYAIQNYLPTIMLRAGFSIDEICKATKVSSDFVNERATRILEFSRPG